MRFANFDPAAFLRDYWQKKPLLVRNPWCAWSNPLDPDDLAGLACEPDVESRLIIRRQDGMQVEHGPLAPERFGDLGNEPWTLLVQAVDHHVPQVAALLAPFRFIPDWRIDDVMVSYATDAGGVGPHFDQYDVFLVQGLGCRRWQVGGLCDGTTALLPHDDLRLLASFTPHEEWVLEPGDMLYVPPGFAHDGVALGDDCMTYSIGFRAPSRRELIAGWCEELVASLDEDDRYTDPGLRPQDNPGEVTQDALDRLHGMLAAKLLDREGFSRWFGSFTTAPGDAAAIDWSPEDATPAGALHQSLANGTALLRNPAIRFAFIRHAASPLSLFVDGEHFACTQDVATFAQDLCANDRLTLDPAMLRSEPVMDLITALLEQGSIALDTDD